MSNRMSFVFAFVALLSAIATCSGLTESTRFTVRDKVFPASHWINAGLAPPDHGIKLRIGLSQPNFHILEKHLYEISDPSHGRYGNHLSKEEVEELASPHPDSIEAVSSWLASHGLDGSNCSRSSANDWVTVRVPVRLAEKMLDTKYYVWTHAVTGDSLVRATSYSLPEHLDSHIDAIQPTTMFAQFKAFKSTIHEVEDTPKGPSILTHDLAKLTSHTSQAVVDASCNTSITLSCLRQLYNIGNFTPSANVGNSIATTGYLEEFANNQDLQSFYADQLPQAVNTTFETFLVNGGTNPQNLSDAGVEANLDTQYAYGLAFPVKSTFYSTGGRPPFNPDLGTPTDTNEPYLDWLQFVFGQKEVPKVISTSYGDHEQTVPKDFAIRVCKDFGLLTARGVSLIFSSGDGGVGDGEPDPAAQTCLTNDGRNITRFIPIFPAACPFVTSVGATFHIDETAVSFSGGGFSDYFPRPQYQASAVPGFLKKLPKGTYAGLFNPNGRGIPDVSAQGVRFQVFIGGIPHTVSGTSASAPAFAGIVALLNDVRLRKRLPPLGFLNPLLYARGVGAFNDITTGNNPGCGTNGFNATKGWDPVTGLGTPNFGKLKNVIV